jgi:type I restriction enzyme S subunit
MGSLASETGYGTSLKCSYTDDGPGVLRIPNIQRGTIDLSDLKHAPKGSDIDDRLFLKPGDLLIVRTNGSRDLIGRCAPVTEELKCSFASYLIRFRMHAVLIDARFLSLMLGAPWWRQRLEDLAASSAGQYNLSLRSLEPLPVLVPPLDEQRRIVTEVERQVSFLEACDRAVDFGLTHAAALRRSVLKSAFEGKLAPQGADEPASALLERIKASRPATKPSRRARATA